MAVIGKKVAIRIPVIFLNEAGSQPRKLRLILILFSGPDFAAFELVISCLHKCLEFIAPDSESSDSEWLGNRNFHLVFALAYPHQLFGRRAHSKLPRRYHDHLWAVAAVPKRRRCSARPGLYTKPPTLN